MWTLAIVISWVVLAAIFLIQRLINRDSGRDFSEVIDICRENFRVFDDRIGRLESGLASGPQAHDYDALERLAGADDLAALASRVTTCEADDDRIDKAIDDVKAALAETIERLNEVQALAKMTGEFLRANIDDTRKLRESVGRLETRAEAMLELIDQRPDAFALAGCLESMAVELRGKAAEKGEDAR